MTPVQISWKKRNPQVDASAAKGIFCLAWALVGTAKQVTGQRGGLGLGKRALSPWRGASPLILGYSEGTLWQMALSQEVQELSTGALVL